MADPYYVSKIEREDGTILTIKDAEARAAISDMDPTLQQILQGVNDIKTSIGDVNAVLEEILVGGGVGHNVIVTTIPNAEVILSNQDNTYRGTADENGEAQITGVSAGTYTVSATYDGAASDTTTIVVNEHEVTENTFATLTISASANTTITLTDGTVTKTLEYTGTSIVQYVSLGTWDLSCNIDDTVVTRSVLVDTYTNQNVNLVPPSKVISRYVDFANGTTTRTGDPNNNSVYSNINRCNVADDGTINAFYGDNTYVEDGSNGQVMVYIPKFYYKVTPDNDGGLDGVHIRKCTWEISSEPIEGFTLHPAFYDPAGHEIDYFLYGAFEALVYDFKTGHYMNFIHGWQMLASVAAEYTPVNNQTRAKFRELANERGSIWHQVGVKQTMAVQMLLAVEYGFNSQSAIGQGVSGNTEEVYVGQTVGNITSGTQDNKTTPVNWRGIENFWGNVFSFVDGININDGTPYICNSYNFVDDTSTGYTQIGFNIPTSEFIITAFGYDSNNPWVILPSEGTQDIAQFDPNGLIGDIGAAEGGWNAAAFGGGTYTEEMAGATMWYCLTSNTPVDMIGGRLMCVPSAE